MRKVYAIIAISTVAAVICTTVAAADLRGGPSGCAQGIQQPGAVVDGCGCSGAVECGSSCSSCDSTYGAGGCGTCRCGICCRHRARIASYGYFNCSCRGSYKFPVPPQSTYHWPGMYSQKYITEYTSPYRFPPLELPKPTPPKDSRTTARPVIQSTPAGLTTIAPAQLAPLPAQRSQRPEPMSERIKRKYGVK